MDDELNDPNAIVSLQFLHCVSMYPSYLIFIRRQTFEINQIFLLIFFQSFHELDSQKFPDARRANGGERGVHCPIVEEQDYFYGGI